MIHDWKVLAERLLRDASVRRATDALRTAGYEVSYNQVDSVRRSMEKRGAVVPKERSSTGPAALKPEVAPIAPDLTANRAAAYGCELLRDATMALFVRRAAEMGCGVVEAGLRVQGYAG